MEGRELIRELISLEECLARQALARDGDVLFDPETGEPQESGALDRPGCLACRGAAWGAVVGGLAVAVGLAVHWGWL